MNKKLLKKVLIFVILAAIAVGCAAGVKFSSPAEHESVRESVSRDIQTQKADKDTITCRVEISCRVLSKNKETLKNDELLKYVPDDGIILKEAEVNVNVDSSAYDVLGMVCMANNIQMEAKYTALYGTYYVQGINYLYEKCAGDESGWIYTVNGSTVSVGASSYKVKDGDCIVWHFTTDGGKDVFR